MEASRVETAGFQPALPAGGSRLTAAAGSTRISTRLAAGRTGRDPGGTPRQAKWSPGLTHEPDRRNPKALTRRTRAGLLLCQTLTAATGSFSTGVFPPIDIKVPSLTGYSFLLTRRAIPSHPSPSQSHFGFSVLGRGCQHSPATVGLKRRLPKLIIALLFVPLEGQEAFQIEVFRLTVTTAGFGRQRMRRSTAVMSSL